MDTPFAQLHHHIKEQSRQPQTRQNCRTGMHLLLCSRKGLALGAPARICPSSLSASRWSGVRCISRLCCGCCGRSCCLSDAMAGCGSACACACASCWWFGARGAAAGPFAVLAATLRALLDPRVMSILWRDRSRFLVCRYRFGRGKIACRMRSSWRTRIWRDITCSLLTCTHHDNVKIWKRETVDYCNLGYKNRV